MLEQVLKKLAGKKIDRVEVETNKVDLTLWADHPSQVLLHHGQGSDGLGSFSIWLDDGTTIVWHPDGLLVDFGEGQEG
jgi:hypothetical protein